MRFGRTTNEIAKFDILADKKRNSQLYTKSGRNIAN